MLKACYGAMINNLQKIIEKQYDGVANCYCENVPCLGYDPKYSLGYRNNELNCKNVFNIYNPENNITTCSNIVLCNERSSNVFKPSVITTSTLELFCNSLKFYKNKNDNSSVINVTYNLNNTHYKYIDIDATNTLKQKESMFVINPTKVIIHTRYIDFQCPCKNVQINADVKYKENSTSCKNVCGVNVENINKLQNFLLKPKLQKCLKNKPNITNITANNVEKNNEENSPLTIVLASASITFAVGLLLVFLIKSLLSNNAI